MDIVHLIISIKISIQFLVSLFTGCCKILIKSVAEVRNQVIRRPDDGDHQREVICVENYVAAFARDIVMQSVQREVEDDPGMYMLPWHGCRIASMFVYVHASVCD